MNGSLARRCALLLVVGVCLTSGCSNGRSELDLAASDPTQDHGKIAAFYSQEAARLRQRAEELSTRIAVYERLFGSTSDWVSGTRLLAQSYEEAAKEHEWLASKHQQLADGRRLSSSAQPISR